jgi:hypothetical protein
VRKYWVLNAVNFNANKCPSSADFSFIQESPPFVSTWSSLLYLACKYVGGTENSKYLSDLETQSFHFKII